MYVTPLMNINLWKDNFVLLLLFCQHRNSEGIDRRRGINEGKKTIKIKIKQKKIEKKNIHSADIRLNPGLNQQRNLFSPFALWLVVRMWLCVCAWSRGYEIAQDGIGQPWSALVRNEDHGDGSGHKRIFDHRRMT